MFKRRKIKTEIRRQQIIDAALQTVAERGIRGLTISSIAQSVGITNSNLYRHFRCKDDVLIAILVMIEDNLKHIIVSAIGKNSSAVSCLEFIFFQHIDFLSRHHGIPRFVFSDEMYSCGSKAVMSHLKYILRWYMQEIRRIIILGIDKGELHKDIDTDAAVMAFLGLIQSTAFQWALFGFSFSLKKRGDKIWSIYRDGILSN